MKLITRIFLLSLTALIFITLIVVIAWLFDSKPENLHLVWMKVINLTGILFILHLLFGGEKE
jgi:hypothetical protein